MKELKISAGRGGIVGCDMTAWDLEEAGKRGSGVGEQIWTIWRTARQNHLVKGHKGEKVPNRAG